MSPRVLAWGSLALLIAAGIPPAAWAKPRNVLLIDAGSPGRPLAIQISEAVREGLAASAVGPVSTYYEGLDLQRFVDPAYAATLRTFLAGKYRQQPPDLFVAIGDTAVVFALALQREGWPHAPIVFAATEAATVETARTSGTATGVIARLDATGSLRVALDLVPEAEEVVFVGGSNYVGLARRALDGLGRKVTMTTITDVPFDEARRRVSRLPAKRVIFYVELVRDANGQGFFGRETLETLAPIANRPIFSIFGTYLGHGIVGGVLLDARVVGREVAQIAARVLSGTPAAEIPVAASQSNRLQFDARQLRRWGIDESHLPPGSEVHFRERSLFEEYRGTLIGIGVVMTIQTGLIAALLLEVQRRRKAQAQSRRLSERILTAQEDERSRIARDLHDGASQQLALFAIELDELGAEGLLSGSASASVGTLAGRARALSHDLHHLAYQLHPAILDQLGLVPALKQFGDEFARRHGIKVDVTASGWPASLPPTISLALFRVAQEALQNVARHSGADDVRLLLRGSAEGITLTVSDTGRGFDPAVPPSGARLGLAGMKERLRLVGGELSVDASVGGGTMVAAEVPRRALDAASAGAAGIGGSDGEATSAAR